MGQDTNLSPEGALRKFVALPYFCIKWDMKNVLRLNDLIAVCVHNFPLIILLMLSSLRNESENENKIEINQYSSVNIRVILYISSIWIKKICLYI